MTAFQPAAAGRIAPGARALSQPLRWLARSTRAAIKAVRDCNDRIHAREDLRDMDEWQLRDLGLTRPDVMAEVNRPFWHS